MACCSSFCSRRTNRIKLLIRGRASDEASGHRRVPLTALCPRRRKPSAASASIFSTPDPSAPVPSGLPALSSRDDAFIAEPSPATFYPAPCDPLDDRTATIRAAHHLTLVCSGITLPVSPAGNETRSCRMQSACHRQMAWRKPPVVAAAIQGLGASRLRRLPQTPPRRVPSRRRRLTRILQSSAARSSWLTGSQLF